MNKTHSLCPSLLGSLCLTWPLPGSSVSLHITELCLWIILRFILCRLIGVHVPMSVYAGAYWGQRSTWETSSGCYPSCDKVIFLCLEFMGSRNLPVPTSLVLGLQVSAAIPAFLYRSAGQPQARRLARHMLYWADSPAPSWVVLHHACRSRSTDLSMDISGTLSRFSRARLI